MGKIISLIKDLEGKIKLELDYLLYKKDYISNIYNKYKKRSDYKVLIIRK